MSEDEALDLVQDLLTKEIVSRGKLISLLDSLQIQNQGQAGGGIEFPTLRTVFEETAEENKRTRVTHENYFAYQKPEIHT